MATIPNTVLERKLNHLCGKIYDLLSDIDAGDKQGLNAVEQLVSSIDAELMARQVCPDCELAYVDPGCNGYCEPCYDVRGVARRWSLHDQEVYIDNNGLMEE
jgi:hypothetical protein